VLPGALGDRTTTGSWELSRVCACACMQQTGGLSSTGEAWLEALIFGETLLCSS
jgi:hypothetical protein